MVAVFCWRVAAKPRWFVVHYFCERVFSMPVTIEALVSDVSMGGSELSAVSLSALDRVSTLTDKGWAGLSSSSDRWALRPLLRHREVRADVQLSGGLIKNWSYPVGHRFHIDDTLGPFVFAVDGVYTEIHSPFWWKGLMVDAPGPGGWVRRIETRVGCEYFEQEEWDVMMRSVFRTSVGRSEGELRDFMHSVLLEIISLVKGEAALDSEFSGSNVGVALVNFHLMAGGYDVVSKMGEDVWSTNIGLLRVFDGDIFSVVEAVVGIGVVFRNMIRQLYLTGWLEHVLPFLPSRLGEVFMHIIHTGFELRCLHPTTGCDYRNSVWKEFGTDELRGLWEQYVDGGFGRLEIVVESWSEFLVWVHTFMETGGVRDLGIHGALDSTGIAEAHGFHIVPVKSVIRPGSIIGARYVSEHSHLTGATGLQYDFDFGSTGLSWGLIAEDPVVLYAADDFWTLATRRGQTERAIGMMVEKYNEEHSVDFDYTTYCRAIDRDGGVFDSDDF